MIRLGYRKNGQDILHETVETLSESNESIESLKQSMVNEPIDYFYKERQTSDTEWEKYAFIDAED